MQWLLRLVLAGLAAMPLSNHSTNAAEKAGKKQPAAVHSTQPPSSAKPSSVSPSTPTIPDGPRLRLLIYTSIIAINQANQTGNYSVLRDLAAPGFREANSAARLAEIFSNLRHRDLDLSPAIFLEPKLIRPPALMDNGMLRLSGYVPSAPEQVNFDLAFQFIQGRWLLFGVGINTSPAATNLSETSNANTPDKKK